MKTDLFSKQKILKKLRKINKNKNYVQVGFYIFNILQMGFVLRGNCTPNQKLACFALYLKIVTTFLQNNVYILKQIVQGTQKWHWNFSRQSNFKLWIKTVKMLF